MEALQFGAIDLVVTGTAVLANFPAELSGDAGLLALGMPIAFVIGLSSVLFFLVQGRLPLTLVVQRLFTASDSFQLMAILYGVAVGASLFVVSSMGRVPLAELSRALVPFILASIAILLLVTYVPALSLWLPSLAP